MRTVFKMNVKGALLMSLVAIVLASINPAYALIYWGSLVVVLLSKRDLENANTKKTDQRRQSLIGNEKKYI